MNVRLDWEGDPCWEVAQPSLTHPIVEGACSTEERAGSVPALEGALRTLEEILARCTQRSHLDFEGRTLLNDWLWMFDSIFEDANRCELPQCVALVLLEGEMNPQIHCEIEATIKALRSLGFKP